ncbi:MAG: nucleotidyltransferase domain-containing protein [Acidobacteriota bacterium]
MAANQDHRAQLEDICRQKGVSILYAFGSRGREVQRWFEEGAALGQQNPSDVDIAVLARRNLKWTVADKVQLAIALEDLFDCPKVDLISLRDADPHLAADAICGERLFAEDSCQADEYDLYVLRRAGDLLPLLREWQALALEEKK